MFKPIDKYYLERFIIAQEKDSMYNCALNEIKTGKKKTHWIWFVFPQHIELGKTSYMHQRYSIMSIDEGYEYMKNEILRYRLIEICQALYDLETADIFEVVENDAKKIQSCCTLFRYISPEVKIFDDILNKYFEGQPCKITMRIIEENNQ